VALPGIREYTDGRYCYFSLESRGQNRPTLFSLEGFAAPGRLRAPPRLPRFAREGRRMVRIRCSPSHYLRLLPNSFFFALVELSSVPAGTPHRPHPPRPPCPVAAAGSAAGSTSSGVDPPWKGTPPWAPAAARRDTQRGVVLRRRAWPGLLCAPPALNPARASSSASATARSAGPTSSRQRHPMRRATAVLPATSIPTAQSTRRQP